MSMNDKQLKSILESILNKNGYKVNDSNLNILKEGLKSGSIVLEEDDVLESEETDEKVNEILSSDSDEMTEDIVKITPIDSLIATLKISLDNMSILHRNIIGENWFGIHKTLEEYYDMIADILDDVAEIAISLGYRELSVEECVKIVSSLGVRDFSCREALEIAAGIFKDLMSKFEACYEMVPEDVKGKFQEYVYTIRKETEYKLKARLK